MKYLFLILVTISIVACGGGGADSPQQLGLNPSIEQSCGAKIADFLNGPKINDASSTTYWGCSSAMTADFAFQIYEDGTGYSNSGAFTWSQTDCGSLQIKGINFSSISDLAGTTSFSDNSSGIMSFSVTSSGQSFPASCVLIQL